MRKTPDIVVLDTRSEMLLRELSFIARLMDSSIKLPGTNISFGLDGLLGLIPGIGDAIGSIASFYIIMRAAKYGLPKAIIGKMIVNVLIDFGLGLVPVVGDIFDFAWKANNKNIELLKHYTSDQNGAVRSSQATLTMLFVFLGLICAAAYSVVLLVLSFFRAIFQGRG